MYVSPPQPAASPTSSDPTQWKPPVTLFYCFPLSLSLTLSLSLSLSPFPSCVSPTFCKVNCDCLRGYVCVCVFPLNCGTSGWLWLLAKLHNETFPLSCTPFPFDPSPLFPLDFCPRCEEIIWRSATDSSLLLLQTQQYTNRFIKCLRLQDLGEREGGRGGGE